MNDTRSIHRVSACLAAAAVILFLGLSAAAMDIAGERPEGIEVKSQDHWVEWSLLIPNDGFILTVSGPGGITTNEYGPGDQAFFAAQDPNGDPRPDGFYKWELVLRDAKTAARSSDHVVGTTRARLSGEFSILGGRVLNAPDPSEMPPLAFTVGDQSFQGRMCVGPDCVDPETWPAAGINEIRLKGTNNRLAFIDTSAGGGGFPEGDWQMKANSSSAGTSNFFSIEWLGNSATMTTEAPVSTPFKIEGEAPNNSVYVDKNGKVGFGTTIPDKKVQIVSTPTANAELHIGGAGDEFKDIFAGMGPELTVGPGFNYGYSGSSFGRSSGFFNVRPDGSAIAPNPSLRFMTANVQRIIVTNLGRVGIGTSFSAPLEALHVVGNIRADGNFISNGTTLNVPDYVFEPGYKLMPIEELAAFVARERHLPDIPNAAEVREKGLNLTEFQLRLLAKIEELTLHLISQNQEVTRLRSENQSLKEVNKTEIESLRLNSAELQTRLAAIEEQLTRRPHP